LISGFLLDNCVGSGSPNRRITLTGPASLGSGGPCGHPTPNQHPSQHQQPPASPPTSHPSAIHYTRNSFKSPPSHQNQSPNIEKPLKTNSFHRFPPCQPGHLQHQLWMPESLKLTPRSPQRWSKSSQAHPKPGFEAPKVTPNTLSWSHGAQSKPNLSPGSPKTHPKTVKI